MKFKYLKEHVFLYTFKLLHLTSTIGSKQGVQTVFSLGEEEGSKFQSA